LCVWSHIQGPEPYLTDNFNSWLNANGYGSFNFQRTDIQGGSFGGKADDSDTIDKDPVIFIHGNGDFAIGTPGQEFNGWVDSITYFMSQGYKESELYATTWGPANPMMVSQQYHSYDYLNYLRNFVEAVINYTNATKIDVIAHSMGVTLGRKVIKGGTGTDGQSYNLGPSLASYVDTFLGLSGANYGLVACQYATLLPTCGTTNGFYPGYAAGVGLAPFLNDLNTNGGREGDHVFAMLTTADDVILFGDLVFGKYTSEFPTEDDVLIYNNMTHMDMKDLTTAEQLKAITQHQI
jgi:pimeloyl-ACP methyl ester carboxylesterase